MCDTKTWFKHITTADYWGEQVLISQVFKSKSMCIFLFIFVLFEGASQQIKTQICCDAPANIHRKCFSCLIEFDVSNLFSTPTYWHSNLITTNNSKSIDSSGYKAEEMEKQTKISLWSRLN